MLSVIMLSVIMLSVIMLNVVILIFTIKPIMLSVILLNCVMVNVINAEFDRTCFIQVSAYLKNGAFSKVLHLGKLRLCVQSLDLPKTNLPSSVPCPMPRVVGMGSLTFSLFNFFG
jgi:hypothetical protein